LKQADALVQVTKQMDRQMNHMRKRRVAVSIAVFMADIIDVESRFTTSASGQSETYTPQQMADLTREPAPVVVASLLEFTRSTTLPGASSWPAYFAAFIAAPLGFYLLENAW
jgi:hypothetical protein